MAFAALISKRLECNARALSGRAALVTGASSDLGRRWATHLSGLNRS
jgi:hypothetical protein